MSLIIFNFNLAPQSAGLGLLSCYDSDSGDESDNEKKSDLPVAPPSKPVAEQKPAVPSASTGPAIPEHLTQPLVAPPAPPAPPPRIVEIIAKMQPHLARSGSEVCNLAPLFSVFHLSLF